MLYKYSKTYKRLIYQYLWIIKPRSSKMFISWELFNPSDVISIQNKYSGYLKKYSNKKVNNYVQAKKISVI